MQFVRYCIFSQFESIFFIQFESLCTAFCKSECATSLPFSLEDAEGGDEEFPWRKISENLVSRKDVWVTRVLGKRAIEGGLVHVLCCVYHSNPHPWLSSCSHGLTISSKRKSENVSTLAGYNSGPFDRLSSRTWGWCFQLPWQLYIHMTEKRIQHCDVRAVSHSCTAFKNIASKSHC